MTSWYFRPRLYFFTFLIFMYIKHMRIYVNLISLFMIFIFTLAVKEKASQLAILRLEQFMLSKFRLIFNIYQSILTRYKRIRLKNFLSILSKTTEIRRNTQEWHVWQPYCIVSQTYSKHFPTSRVNYPPPPTPSKCQLPRNIFRPRLERDRSRTW